jgi:hypothetical protein
MTATEPLRDKREGGCLRNPGKCQLPRRCWQYETCFIYSKSTK